MDQPDLDPHLHRAALRGLARLNTCSHSAGMLWPALTALAREVQPRTLRVLDLATGGGDVPIRLSQRARRTALPLDIAGCDRSPTALAHAEAQARRSGAAVSFFPADVLTGPLPEGYDVVMCSLFLHHLDEAQAVTLLAAMARAARRLVLVNDLRRCRAGWLLAYAATRLLSRSPVVHTDGPRSVAAAFTLDEAIDLAACAGLTGATVVPRWPFRFLLTWRRP
jgi:SAM-dependent methyltransferase